jgi:hypothetical protein
MAGKEASNTEQDGERGEEILTTPFIGTYALNQTPGPRSSTLAI